jgi:hypothetical protein
MSVVGCSGETSKPTRQVERLGVFRPRADEDGANADHFRGLQHAARRVADQGATEAALLMSTAWEARAGKGAPAGCASWLFGFA